MCRVQSTHIFCSPFRFDSHLPRHIRTVILIQNCGSVFTQSKTRTVINPRFAKAFYPQTLYIYGIL